MRWIYHIPHSWEPGRRHPWGTVWLKPDGSVPDRPAISLTIDAFGDTSDPAHGSERALFQEEALAKLGGKECWIGGDEMIVNVRDFNRAEFLDWVQVWLRQIDPGFETLGPGRREVFSWPA
jgi:hypothetical protein